MYLIDKSSIFTSTVPSLTLRALKSTSRRDTYPEQQQTEKTETEVKDVDVYFQ